MLKCLKCHDELHKTNLGFFCNKCGCRYPLIDGVFRFSDCVEGADFFPESAFNKLYEFEANNFWFKVRNLIIGHGIKRYLLPESKILEVGCGTGFVSLHLKNMGYNVDCADFSIKGLNYCKKRDAGNSYFQFNLCDKLFFNHYDCICAFDVIEHIDDDLLVLRNMKRALKPNGFVIITVPGNKKIWSEVDELALHKRRYELKELRDKIEYSDFKILRITYFMTFLFPFLYISRAWGKRHLSSNHDNIKSNKELSLNPILNLTFYYIFRIEACLLKYINLPFGSSLICIAQNTSD